MEIQIDNNGFMTTTVNGEDIRLFWLPGHLQDIGGIFISRLHMLAQMGATVQIDLSQFAHGSQWADCYSDPLSRPAS